MEERTEPDVRADPRRLGWTFSDERFRKLRGETKQRCLGCFLPIEDCECPTAD